MRKDREDFGCDIPDGLLHHPERCRDWKWYIPFPFCIPYRISHWWNVRKLFKELNRAENRWVSEE